MTRGLVVFTTLVLLGVRCAPAQPVDSSPPAELLLTIPDPNFEGADPSVARQILDQLQQTRALAADAQADPVQLAKAFGELGQSLLLYDLLDPAEASFRNAATLVPGDHRAPYYLGVITQELRRFDEAIEFFETVLRLDPSYVSALIRLGDIHRIANRPEEADGYYRRALEVLPASPAAHWGLGQLASAAGDPQAAIGHFEAVLEAQPGASAAHYPLALAYRELGDMENARRHLELRGEQPVHLLDPLVDGLSRRVTGASIYMTRGNQAFGRGDFEMAVGAYRKAVEGDPENVTARHALATALNRSGRTEEAIGQLLLVLAQDENNAVAHYNLGTMYSELGDPEKSLDHIKKAVEISPDLANARFNLGILLERQGRLDEALEQYAEVRKLDPQDTGASIRYAMTLGRLGRSAEAETGLREILTVNPESSEARLALAGVLASTGRPEDALQELHGVAATSEDRQAQARAHFEAGRIRVTAGDIEGAIRDFEQTVELMPGVVEVRLALANALARTRHFSRASQQFDLVVQQQPGLLEAHRGRALALLLGGEDARAVASLEESLSALDDDLQLLHLLARILATSEDPDVRDGQRALELSRGVLARQPNLRRQETVAMALAELGRFDEARELQAEILQQAKATSHPEVAGIEERLNLYVSGQPARSPWLGESD